MTTLRKLPFTLQKGESFQSKSIEWIGDVFYQILPDAGYEIREEQIFTAFRMFEAFTKRELIFAEAGLGTGKTFAYLIGALLYSRHIGKPVVISCGSNSLVDQLLHPDGDIAKLSQVLQVEIDARAALEENQYMCMRKIQALRDNPPDLPGIERLLHWSATTKYGFRFEIPEVSDELWNRVRRETPSDCGECHVKYRCPFIRAKEYYRGAADLIICSHAFYFNHIRTRDTYKEQGHLPLLPAHAAVVFDEAHQVEDTARRALGEHLVRSQLITALERLATVGVRESFFHVSEALIDQTDEFFAQLELLNPPKYVKTALHRTDEFEERIATLDRTLAHFLDEVSIEEGLTNTGQADYTLTRRHAWSYINRMESILRALRSESEENVVWLERDAASETVDEVSLWVAPFRMDMMLQKEVYSSEIPVIYSSATLAQGKSFEYVKKHLGADQAKTSQVSSPFDYEEQCIIYVPEHLNSVKSEDPRQNRELSPYQLTEHLLQLLRISDGRALVLFQNETTMEEVKQLLEAMPESQKWNFLWEGTGTTSHLLQQFREDVSSVLLGVSYWEGISITGSALSHCIIAELPFFGEDPLILKKREQAVQQGLEPFHAVDIPEMLIRLKQGTGRLIRSQTDYGIISCIDTRFRGTQFEQEVLQAFPADAQWIDHFEQLEEHYVRLRHSYISNI